jgi:hypothetical protein
MIPHRLCTHRMPGRTADRRAPARRSPAPVPAAVPIPARALALAPAFALVLALAGCANEREAAFDPDLVPDAYRYPTGALMTPGSTRAWQVTPEGNLYNGAWRLKVSPAAGPDTAGPPLRIAAEDRWLPVLHWKRRSGSVLWEFSAAALAQRAPRDSQLIVSLQVRAHNEGTTEADARLGLELEAGVARPAWVAWDLTPEPPRWGGGTGRDPVHAWSDEAGAGGTFSHEWRLAAGESRTVRVVLPAYPTRERDLHRFAARPHHNIEARVRRMWRRELKRGATFELGDPEVEYALRAATVVLLSLRERRGERWVPIGGPFQYRDVWLRDGARAIAALSVAGHTRVARELAEGFLLLQWPNGAFLSQRGQLDGPGQALWAIEQAWLRPPGAGRELTRFADAAMAAAHWFALQRELGPRIEGDFPNMLPFADPRDGELIRAQLTGNDAWGIAGLRSTARLLAAAGRATEAGEVAAAARVYREDFAQALVKSGHPDLPPSWQAAGRDWGSFAAAWPCAAIGADDPRAAAFARRVWAAGGGAGLTFYSTPDSLHGYLGADLGVWAMLTGRRAAAESVLVAHLRWRTASGTAGELFDRTGNFGGNLPPHPTSATALLMLVRNALIFDDDEDTLRLTLGARERWWKGSRITRAPTRWGVTDLEFAREGSRASWKWSPVPVWSALTLPPGSALAAAAPAPLIGATGATVVLAPPGTREAAVEIATAGGP